MEAAKGPEDLDGTATPAAQLQAQLDEERQRSAEAAAAKTQLEQQLTSLKSESEEVRSSGAHSQVSVY